jgi:hypothetical protein
MNARVDERIEKVGKIGYVAYGVMGVSWDSAVPQWQKLLKCLEELISCCVAHLKVSNSAYVSRGRS